MNNLQKTYKNSKAALEVAKAYIDAGTMQYSYLLGEDRVDGYYSAMEEFEVACGIVKLEAALRAAEKSLIEWAQAKMKNEFPEKYAETLPAFNAKSIKMRTKVLELCLRLS